ncbi:GntR family transcriptional regulator [Paenibacillus sp. PsM32]|uniref:GntR family transcriptional regulator n=1 Tax=unclassified Paenibacillus TaxID=185978 RepID=UPI0023653963|nr:MULTISPECIES: GntR family transcriptional regulator [unclassified Paenibacillus]MDN4619171.1 GntR family transcriptional regulator [Paenibacillus sp. PsM32]MDQ1236849.1 GntR family transcriptional regulator of arabinose operon [Paenibacillus sp. SORGH_AS_0306]MDR6109211.1 GntR family transcriptional regulator of arabinose operon [Paenibacillus sp. SORGH_AS_0338]WDF50648.1 GntR family transcriptional regulator [Paenibacillus sp. KACC 21273]
MADSSISLKPRYEQMYLTLRNRFHSGEYTIGDKIPSEKELMEQFEVSRITSKKALDMLVQDGYIVRQPGRGSFVIYNGDQLEVIETEDGDKYDAPSRPRTDRNQIVLGLIMEDFSDSYGKEMLVEMERTAQKMGVYLMLRLSFSQTDIEENAIRMLRDYGVDGLIIYPTRGQIFNSEILKLVIDRFPHVLVDRYVKGIDSTSISTDNVAAASLGTHYLLDQGHRHIALLTSKVTDNVAIEERIEGFVQAHAERGVVLDRSSWLTDMYWNSNQEEDEQVLVQHNVDMIQQMIEAHPQITALFAMQYELALFAKEAIEHMGLHIPQDISIICFDSPQASAALYPFTHMQQDQQSLGRLAIENVLALIEGASLPSKISLQANLIHGHSVAEASVHS